MQRGEITLRAGPVAVQAPLSPSSSVGGGKWARILTLIPECPALVLPRRDRACHLTAVAWCWPSQRKWGSLLGVRLWEGHSCCGCLGRPQGRVMTWLDPPNGWLAWKGQSHVLHCSGAGCQLCALRWKQEPAAILPCTASTALSSFLVELGIFACMKEGCTPQHQRRCPQEATELALREDGTHKSAGSSPGRSEKLLGALHLWKPFLLGFPHRSQGHVSSEQYFL